MNVIDKEYNWFLKNLRKLYDKYGDTFLAIKNGKVLGTYKTFADGVIKTQKKEKLGTFIVQKCSFDGKADNVYISSLSRYEK